MTRYEERLQRDLETIRGSVHAMGERVRKALTDAVHALLAGDRSLASETILGDLPINRASREIDRLCHAFVARHLPSAGHLRFVSSVLRLNVGLERIGDYAVTLCRETVQLSAPVPEPVAGDVELLADHAKRTLAQALRSFHEQNAELARGTMGMAGRVESAAHKVFSDLVRAGEEDSRPVKDLFALLVVFNRLERVSDQAKNICEETLFAVTGETKAPKVYRILFVDERNDARSQMAAAFARKAFPESGVYDSAGWRPADGLDARFRLFMEESGYDLGEAAPSLFEPLHEVLARYHVVVCLDAEAARRITEVPFHTVVLTWDMGPGLAGLDQERARALLERDYRTLSDRVTGLMETLRGEGAG